MTAFVDGQYARCVDLLRPARSQAHVFGGSHAQRDLIDQTLLTAARRSDQHSLARGLQRERELLARQRSAA
ncbi:hypothetical protein NA643_12310 [Pseudomonas stutzeri]|uniref:hypothetical protein n=1 Tax=Stutzerimonas stutzeri TaxID=316 RepID=UPI00210987C8|nr:hypothetical protein [Stutzerimonas stutzeri]MCQ4279869.1 hypothetical protein [Stutzerimonas stutzeri]